MSVACCGASGTASSSAAAGALAEVNCETDFAARNELLTALASDAAAAALKSVTSGGASPPSSSSGVVVEASSVPELAPLCSDAAAAAAAVVRENVVVRRVARVSSTESAAVVGSYVHSPIAPGASIGRMAAVVVLAPLPGGGGGGKSTENLSDLANKLAMHVVAARPLSLDRDSLPAELVESERAIAAAQASSSGKPAAIADRIVAGRLSKWYEEVALLEQKLVTDETGKKDVASAAREAGARVVAFARLQVGEGLEAEKEGASGEDFKSEVERLAGGV